MSAFLTMEEVKLWRSSTEKITLEEFAQRLGKTLNYERKTNDLHDMLENKSISNETEQESGFRKELSDREKIIYNYFIQKKGKTVSVKELAQILKLPRNYIYKYIKNLREKLDKGNLVNANDGGYILHIA
jgi:DNA-binding CsgD family transcriptional regulator